MLRLQRECARWRQTYMIFLAVIWQRGKSTSATKLRAPYDDREGDGFRHKQVRWVSITHLRHKKKSYIKKKKKPKQHTDCVYIVLVGDTLTLYSRLMGVTCHCLFGSPIRLYSAFISKKSHECSRSALSALGLKEKQYNSSYFSARQGENNMTKCPCTLKSVLKNYNLFWTLWPSFTDRALD